MNDPIVEEVRKAREEYAARFNYDLKAICKDLHDRAKAMGIEVVTRSPKKVERRKRRA